VDSRIFISLPQVHHLRKSVTPSQATSERPPGSVSHLRQFASE